MRPLRRLILVTSLLTLMVSGCAITPQPELTEAEQQQLLTAQELERSGQTDAAIGAWRTLAATAPQPLASRYALRAVELLIDAGRLEEARQALAALPPEQIVPEEQARIQTLQAQLDQLADMNLEALAQLPEPTDAMPAELRARILEVRAAALARIDQPLAAVRTRIERGPLLSDAAAIEHNQQALWNTLNTISVTELELALSEAESTGLRGWLALALETRRAQFDPQALAAVLDSWMQRYPAHPAADTFVFALLEQSREATIRPERIALLLPLSGRLAEAGQAVMNGLLSAWYEDGLDRPEILVRDVAGDPADVVSVHAEVATAGADLIIGPLDKAAVTELTALQELVAPTLTLNYADDPGIAPSLDLFQFGLLPEDEARQVADLAIARGDYRAVVLTPGTEWGDRLAQAFGERYGELGGELLEEARFAPQENDFSAAIERLLNLDASERRYRRLVQILGMRLEFEPRRRQDVDAIFLAANPRQGRLIKPQLKFHRASDLPVYATSHISSGIADPEADRDINGVIYTEMPWTLKSGQLPLYAALASLWPKEMERFAELFALGADAYRLVPYLRRMQARPEERFAGYTGVLWMDEQGRLHRDLLFAIVERGQPRPLDLGQSDDTLAPETPPPEQDR